MKLSKILHIGTLICEGAGVALGIAALFTQAAGVLIATVVVGSVAWALSQAEECLKEDSEEHIRSESPEDIEDNSDILPTEGDSDFALDLSCYTNQTIDTHDTQITGEHNINEVEV